MISVVIADDHPIVRAGLKQIITEEADIAVAGEASNGLELLNLVRQHEYDVILLDMNFQRGKTEGTEGIRWLETIRKLDSRAVVILMTAFGDVELAVDAMKQGATDFMTKPINLDKLELVLDRVLKAKKIEIIPATFRETMALGCNVIARLNPQADKKVVFSAHIDAYEDTPGASDNASGTGPEPSSTGSPSRA